ncbi:MAG: UbiA family prenyltransferase [Saprospiraceae bacterium]|nr:UbiA family prenyltransferase [Saprospiraceae bacterium]
MFLGLVFFSTLFIYATHRLVSLCKVDKKLKVERFHIIGTYRRHILIYTLVGALGSAITFWFLTWTTQLLLILPALLSLAYVLPFLGGKRRRLRDVNFIKIFLIAITWAYVTVVLVLTEHEISWNYQTCLVLVERFLFIFAITLPFDLRDWKIDQAAGVLTLPVYLGEKGTIILAQVLLTIATIISFWIYPSTLWGAYLLAQAITAFLIYQAPGQKHDYYFTGFLDGTMWIRPILVILLGECLR